MEKLPSLTPQKNTSVNGLVSSWSHSTLMNFQRCKRIVYFDKVEKQKRPELIPPPGKEEHPMLRGNRVHDAGELYIRGEVELVPEFQSFAEQMSTLRDFYDGDDFLVIMEEEWAFDINWEPCGWKSEKAWVRMKVDCLVINLKTGEAILIDYKTGRKHGNEIKHAMQAQLYQLATFIKYPELDAITVEFWYTDQNELTKFTYKRSFGMRYKQLFTGFGHGVTNEVEFRATPAPSVCKYCDWGRNKGTGVCVSDYYLGAKKSG